VALLESQAVQRVQELVPIRYGRMLVSPFTFYRGAALIMADDLSRVPRSGLEVQLCGDAHLSNFGLFASPERKLVFDLNDFDETHPGPFEWDVKRLAASFEIAAREIGLKERQRRQVVLSTVGTYRTTIREFAGWNNLAVWYAQQEIQTDLAGLAAVHSKITRTEVKRAVRKAFGRDQLETLRALTETVDGQLRFISQPPLMVPARELEDWHRAQLRDWLTQLVNEYGHTLSADRRHLLGQYHFVDIARKVVGVGSVGTRAWVVLLCGLDDQDALILQAKEATASVLEAYTAPSEYASHGERVVEGQRLMQAHGDIMLGWHHFDDNSRPDYYVRQLRDWKGSLDVEHLDTEGLAAYGGYCAWALARAHARGGDRVAIASYLGGKDTFDQAVADFAAAYADKNDRDYAQLAAAARDGKIQTQQA